MKYNDSIKLFPTTLEGTINVPTSKSLTHRALIAAALAKGMSTIRNIVFSDDILATINALKQIGAKIDIEGNNAIVKGIRSLKTPTRSVDCNESGSTLRFLIPILALTNNPVTFVGATSLLKRPQSVYSTLAKQDGISFEQSDSKIVVNGSFKGRKYNVKGTISSQFFTGLMFSLPLLNVDTYLMVDGPLESKGYIDLTIDILKRFNIKIDEIENGYFIEGNQTFKPNDYTVEGDYSQAAFFFVGATLNGSVNIGNLPHESLQGDRQIIDVIKKMKGQVVYTEDGYIVNKSKTSATTVNLSNCPDLGPIIALLASLSDGTTKIVGASRLRLKESDRIESTVTTLKTLGASIKTDGDDIIIHGKQSLQGGTIDSFNDHRIAMMAAIAATRCDNPVTITQASAVKKSYPHFYEDYVSLGGKIE